MPYAAAEPPTSAHPSLLEGDGHPGTAAGKRTAAIRVVGLTKSYGGRRVVDGMDLVIERGRIVALLGPNGAGKTTTVECIEGFRRPEAGTVRVFGADPIADRDRLTSRVGIMLQEGGVWQAASPREVLRLYARLHPQAVDPEDLIERLGLSEVAGSRYRTLSGGEKQRLNLALALVGRPELLVLDEPTTGMDPEIRQSTWDLIREQRDEQGMTVLLTTHFMQEAEVLCDRVAVMARGRLLAEGTVSSLMEQFAPSGLVITSRDAIDAADLAAALGTGVTQAAPDRWIVSVSARQSQELMPAVTNWFADTGHQLTSLSAAGNGLESAYLELTRQAFGEPVHLPKDDGQASTGRTGRAVRRRGGRL